MTGLRIPAIVSGGLFALIVLLAFVGNGLQSAGIVKNPAALETPVKIVFFTLFVLFGFSLIPLMVRIVLGTQAAIGNAGVGPIKAAIAHSNWIVAVIWALMAAGIAVALPAAIRAGFFGK